MYIYFDTNGVLKEIITDRPFRAGDSLRDKIYIYWEGEHTPIGAFIKYRLPNGSYTNEEMFSTIKVVKKLPDKPLRNLRYFSYEHTYNGQIGYPFYEIVVPDEVLSSGLPNEFGEYDATPTQNNLVSARVRFVMDENNTYAPDDNIISTLGVIVFSVENDIGIITDSSINETQYNYLVKIASEGSLYFTPHVSEDGVISWTNNRDVPNPEPVNIKGPRGYSVDRAVQTEISTEDEGINETEFYNTNNEMVGKIQVRNGSKGSKGDKGDDALNVLYFALDETTGHLIMHYLNYDVSDIYLVNDDPSSSSYYETLGVSSDLVGHLIFLYDEGE